MCNDNGLIQETAVIHDLGVVICSICNNIYATIPTEFVRKINGICDEESCRQHYRRKTKLTSQDGFGDITSLK
jgi:hypothetical protein